MCAGDILQIDCALSRIHFVMVKMDAEFQIGYGEIGDAEVPLAGIAFWSRKY